MRRKASVNNNIKYEDYENMIKARALFWSNKTGMEFEELKSEGNIVFCKSLKIYDQSISTFSTFLYNSLQLHYRNIQNKSFSKKRKNHDVYELDDGLNTSKSICVETETIFRGMINDLPNDAKEVVKAIFETPAEIIEVLEIKKLSRHSLFRYFTQIRGWKQARIWKAFQIIQQAIS